MNPKLRIFSPIWKTRSVGIATHLIRGNRGIEVEIVYEKKDGTRLYPNPFYIPVEEVRCYPKQQIGNITVHIVPINAMYEITRVPG